jgi:hypothetical protein
MPYTSVVTIDCNTLELPLLDSSYAENAKLNPHTIESRFLTTINLTLLAQKSTIMESCSLTTINLVILIWPKLHSNAKWAKSMKYLHVVQLAWVGLESRRAS